VSRREEPQISPWSRKRWLPRSPGCSNAVHTSFKKLASPAMRRSRHLTQLQAFLNVSPLISSPHTESLTTCQSTLLRKYAIDLRQSYSTVDRSQMPTGSP
jgi:hypothetical protein